MQCELGKIRLTIVKNEIDYEPNSLNDTGDETLEV